MPHIYSIMLESGQSFHVKGAMMCADIDNSKPIRFSVWNTSHEHIGDYSIEPIELIKLLQIYSQGKTTGGKNG